jgi:hypothetical protein
MHGPVFSLIAGATSRFRSLHGVGVNAQREITNDKTHFSSVDVPPANLRKHSALELTAVRALKVREFHDPD